MKAVQIFRTESMSLYHQDINSMLSRVVTLQELQIPPNFNFYLVINKFITVLILKTYLFIIPATSNLLLLVTSMQSKHSPEVWQTPLETSCLVIKSFKRCLFFYGTR